MKDQGSKFSAVVKSVESEAIMLQLKFWLCRYLLYNLGQLTHWVPWFPYCKMGLIIAFPLCYVLL